MNKKLKDGIVCALWCLGSIGVAGCSGDDAPGGEPVALSFQLCRLTAGEVSTRADATSADMEDGKAFRIYAFPADASITATQPLDYKDYTVTGGVATGELYLYRGTYDLYLVSYNSSTDLPVLSAGGTIATGNGKDFMYTTLKGIVVQPNQTGENHMSVVLPEPFKRMGAQVQVTVAGNTSSPVTPTSLVVQSFQMKGLCESLTYTLGSSVWNAHSGAFNGSYPFTGFTNNGTGFEVKKKRESSSVVLLPVDGTSTLDFEIELEVGFNDNGTAKVWRDVYPVSIQKVLLPGMTYLFDFTLTFYGILNPGDLTLAVRDYESTVTIDSDGLGKNK